MYRVRSTKLNVLFNQCLTREKYMHAFLFFILLFLSSPYSTVLYLFLAVGWTRKLVGYLLNSIYVRVDYYVLCISSEDERKILPDFLYTSSWQARAD